MGPLQPSGRFLWYFSAAQWQLGSGSTQREDYPALLSEALQMQRSCSSAAHRRRVYRVKVRRHYRHSENDRGNALQTDPPCDRDGENTDVHSVRKGEDDLECIQCTTVSTYEDTVAVASANHLYVSSPTCLGRKLRGRVGSTRLEEYMRLALEDEVNEHVLPLIEASAIPKQICSPETVVSVACGTEHLLLCTSLGRLYSMGSNRHGQLGRGSRTPDIMGLDLVHLFDENSSDGSGVSCSPAAVGVYAGSNFSYVIARNRSTLGKSVDFSSFERSRQSAEGTALGDELSCSSSSSEATRSSTAQRKGMTLSAEPATSRIGHTVPSVPSKTLPSRAEVFAREICKSFCRGKGETLYSWGCNDYGQLGHGTKESAVQPVQIKRPEGVSSWNSVAAGFAHVVVLTDSNTVYSCGLNLHGQLGLETTREEASLHKVDLPEPVAQVSCGTWHTLFLTFTGHLLTAGRPPEFPYAAWLQSAFPLSEMCNMNPIHFGIGLKWTDAAEKVSPATSSAVSSTILKRNSALQGSPLKTAADRIQAPASTSNFHEIEEPGTPGTAVLSSCHHVLLSTTRQLCKSCLDTNTLAQSTSSTASVLSGSQSTETIPFAHAPGIVRIEGFLDELKCISAGQTTSAAIGFDEHTKQYRLYVWRAAEPREHPENWLFMSEVYDLSPLLEIADDTERTTVACSCAASGVYVWAQTSLMPFSKVQP